ncbi:MAG: hypothetical protein FWD17_04590, partial [Polyangiaceae bacterium]|nr:hypothetical protein [Polyangiaceae bacterium]
MSFRNVQFLCIVGATVALVSCGSKSGAERRDGIDGGTEGGTDASGVFQCPSDAGVEPPLPQFVVDGGVGIGEYVHAMAIARCNYFSRCAGLAAYVVNECVEALTTYDSWTYWNCPSTSDNNGLVVCGGQEYNQNSATLVRAAQAGTIQYDSARAGQCVAALLAEGCGDRFPVEYIADCVGVFTCATGADPASGGAADGNAPDVADGGAAGGGAAADATTVDATTVDATTVDATTVDATTEGDAANGDVADAPDGDLADGDEADGDASDAPDDGPVDGGVVDGAAAGSTAAGGGAAAGGLTGGGAAPAVCAALPWYGAVLPTCASDADCAAGYCVGGFCSPSQCYLSDQRFTGCTAYAKVGQPCVDNAMS